MVRRPKPEEEGKNKIFQLGIAKQFGKNITGIMDPRDMDKINDFGSNAFTDSVGKKGHCGAYLRWNGEW